jgi:hypothetical protein
MLGTKSVFALIVDEKPYNFFFEDIKCFDV